MGSADSIFRYLKNEPLGLMDSRKKWSFTKFLVGRDGKPLKHFTPFTTPEKIEATILSSLKI